MTPALLRSAFLTLCQALSLVACSTTPETPYHLVPEPSPGAMIAVAPSSSAVARVPGPARLVTSDSTALNTIAPARARSRRRQRGSSIEI